MSSYRNTSCESIIRDSFKTQAISKSNGVDLPTDALKLLVSKIIGPEISKYL